MNDIPMPWDIPQTQQVQEEFAKQSITMAIDNLKDLGLTRWQVATYLIAEVRDIFKKGNQ